MKNATLALLGLIAFGVGGTANAALAEHFGKTVLFLQTDAVSSCYFFQLTGVSQANPVVTNGVWFAIDKNAQNWKELYSVVLSARLTDRALTRVLTNGDLACGQAKVLTIDL